MSGTIVGLLVLALVLFVVVMIVLALRRDSVCYGSCNSGCGGCDDVVEDEVVTTVTTTTVTEDAPRGGHVVNGYVCQGFLAVVNENGQDYVIDPADGVKTPVSPSDDLYQDAANNIWELR